MSSVVLKIGNTVQTSLQEHARRIRPLGPSTAHVLSIFARVPENLVCSYVKSGGEAPYRSEHLPWGPWTLEKAKNTTLTLERRHVLIVGPGAQGAA